MNLLLADILVDQMLNELEGQILHTMKSNCILCLAVLPLARETV